MFSSDIQEKRKKAKKDLFLSLILFREIYLPRSRQCLIGRCFEFEPNVVIPYNAFSVSILLIDDIFEEDQTKCFPKAFLASCSTVYHVSFISTRLHVLVDKTTVGDFRVPCIVVLEDVRNDKNMTLLSHMHAKEAIITPEQTSTHYPPYTNQILSPI